MIEALPWDSAFFGVPIGRARPPIDDVVEEARARGLACVYLLADAGEVATIHAAEARGFRVVDVRVTFERATEAPGAPAPVRDAVPADHAALVAAAAVAFPLGRWFADGHFARARGEAFYATWMERDLREHRVRVVEQDGAVAGYVTVALRGDEASIGLIGVLAGRRGAGLGRTLVHDAIAVAHAEGARTITVVTQGANLAAQRLYQRMGFVTRSVELWLHLWPGDPGSRSAATPR